MSFTWGATVLPLVAADGTDAVTDKAASVLLAYFRAFLNAHAPVAWQSVFKSTVVSVPTTPVVGAFVNDPATSEFNERDLPALFLWRTGGVQREGGDDDWIAADWRVMTDNWTLLWIFPTAVQGIQQARDPIVKGLAALLGYALKRGRDSSYAITGDADISAATRAALPTAIKTSIASSTSAQVYSGAALNGSIGAGAISPQRAPTVTTGATLAAFTPGSTVTFTGLNGLGAVTVSTATIGAALGTFAGDYDLASVTSIAVDGQASAAGTLTFGLAARTGLGSVVLRHAGLMSCAMLGWKKRTLPVTVGTDPPVTRNYDALEISLRTEEKLEEEIVGSSVFAQSVPIGGVDVSFVREDETEIESAIFDP